MNKLWFLFPLLLAGCATNYDGYVDAQKAIAAERAKADIAKYAALADIAKTGDAAARVAAAMGIALGPQGQQPQQQITPPRSQADTLLAAISVVLPSVAQIYGINRQVALGMEQVRGNVAIQQAVSNAGVANTASTNNTFFGIASKIQAPAANVTTTTNTQNPTTVVEREVVQVVEVDKIQVVRPEIVQQDKIQVVNPQIVNPTVVRPEVVNPIVVRPEVIKPEAGTP